MWFQSILDTKKTYLCPSQGRFFVIAPNSYPVDWLCLRSKHKAIGFHGTAPCPRDSLWMNVMKQLRMVRDWHPRATASTQIGCIQIPISASQFLQNIEMFCHFRTTIMLTDFTASCLPKKGSYNGTSIPLAQVWLLDCQYGTWPWRNNRVQWSPK